mmetsp:Transcript_102711/g.268066  ORF Transcript_102711/g.268066 Transcript_102711/m.268066 type:complete len:471 (+) Transcript_102711:185-1597(+)
MILLRALPRPGASPVTLRGLLFEALLIHLIAGFPVPTEPGAAGAGLPPAVACGVRRVPLRMYRSLVRNDDDSPLAFRTTYMSSMTIGSSRQQTFQVIFDTGSGQVIVPSTECESRACRMHSRYNFSASADSYKVQMDGRRVRAPQHPETVTIQFGAGKVTGEMVRDLVCLGGQQGAAGETCVGVNAVAATKLSSNPFGVFPFDGIVGLGLPMLSLTREFNLISALHESGEICRRQFAFYVAEGGEGSEAALGGVNPDHLDSPMRWVRVVAPEKGHWQVEILGFHVGNTTLELCRHGGCRGVLDTGTSHIAVPAPHQELVTPLLSSLSADRQDCRFLDDYPPIIIELRGLNLTLHPQDYMRQMPLPSDIEIGSGSSAASSDDGDADADARNATAQDKNQAESWSCKSRVVGVTMPPQIGDAFFILGQPVFHRYYVAFDYEGPRLGFGLAAARSVEPSDEEWMAVEGRSPSG